MRTLLVAGMAVLFTACSSNRDRADNTPQPQPQIQPALGLTGSRSTEATPRQRSVLRTDLAAGYYERGQMGVALEELAEAVRLDPDNARAYNIYGLIYTVLGDDAKATQSFQRALALAPDDSDIHHNWGWYLCTHGKAREALKEFEAALRNPLYRTPETALVNAGRCAASLGEVKDAEAYYRRALATAPQDGNAAYGLALLAYKAARLQEARGLVKNALARAMPTPEALYLGMCIERNLGDRQAELSYVSQLRNRYPDAAETRAIASGTCE
ncbi:MAG: type IV pilus biogenesis/stability protein PilW [Casimicrobiaceae bacterium]